MKNQPAAKMRRGQKLGELVFQGSEGFLFTL
jgi:hypothetical protein